jgi:hypothetical protein
VHGHFAVDCTDPLTALLGRIDLRENLVSRADWLDHAAHANMQGKFEDWCIKRNIHIQNIYAGFTHCIPTFFLEQQILFAAEFQTRDDAMLFRLSWIN